MHVVVHSHTLHASEVGLDPTMIQHDWDCVMRAFSTRIPGTSVDIWHLFMFFLCFVHVCIEIKF
jgi:hypothetical protein